MDICFWLLPPIRYGVESWAASVTAYVGLMGPEVRQGLSQRRFRGKCETPPSPAQKKQRSSLFEQQA
eukprot:9419874-Lingulodinium_polyedra.AAC.1